MVDQNRITVSTEEENYNYQIMMLDKYEMILTRNGAIIYLMVFAK